METSPRVAIVDFGAGNLRSVSRALEAAGAEPFLTRDPEDLFAADGIVLPGVGAAADAVANLQRHGLDDAVRRAAAGGVPLLGVCLGLQLLYEWSEEGDQPCLGVLAGTVRRLPPGRKIPHMGWNSLEIVRPQPLVRSLPDPVYGYFVHSYVADPVDAGTVVAWTDYDGARFPSIVATGNVMATQFHPEKSGADGLRLYANFVALLTRARVAARGRH